MNPCSYRLSLFVVVLSTACGETTVGESTEPQTVVRRVFIEPVPNTFDRADGTSFELTNVEVTMGDLEFTTGGEAHTAMLPSLWDIVVPSAHAHPGHFSGGEVLGELPGIFTTNLLLGGQLGEAQLLEGEYQGLNFAFGPSEQNTSMRIAGIARWEGNEREFSIDWVSTPDVQVIGIPFEANVAADDETQQIHISIKLTNDGQTILDDLEFVVDERPLALGPDDEGSNRIKRKMLTHDFYDAEAR